MITAPSESTAPRRAPRVSDAAPHRSCQLCRHEPLVRFEVPGSTVLWRCTACGLYQGGRLVETTAYAASYHEMYARRGRSKRRTAAVRLARIASVVDRPEPRLLDVGCSVGATVEAADRLGWSAAGVDVSADAVAFCRERGLDCRLTEGTSLPFPDASFDVVTAWHVVEHVEDVRETLAEWRRVLRPGGVLAMETPDGNCPKARIRGTRYRRFWAPEHTYTFTAPTLAAFCREADLEIVHRPWLGRISLLGVPLGGYAALYQAAQGLRRGLGLSKAFQIFCRRRDSDC